MPRPALTDEQRRKTRQKIRQAAAALYADEGLRDISARSIAEKAGVSVGTLYSYFANLTELMQSLWKEPVSRLIRSMEAQLEEIDDPAEKLRVMLRGYIGFAVEQRNVYRGAFMYVRPASHEQPIPVSLDDDRFFSLFRRVVEEAQDAGVVRDGDVNVIAQVLWSGLHGALSLPQNIDRLALDPPEVAVEPMLEALLEWVEKR